MLLRIFSFLAFVLSVMHGVKAFAGDESFTPALCLALSATCLGEIANLKERKRCSP